MLTLQCDIENAGDIIAFKSAVVGGNLQSDGIVLRTRETALKAKLVINACGLYAPAVAQSIEGMPKHIIPRAYFAKRNYFALKGLSPFNSSIRCRRPRASASSHARPWRSSPVRAGRRMDRDHRLYRR